MNALRIFLPIEIWSSISLTTFELMVIWWLALSLRISDFSSWPNMLFNAWLPITKSKHYPLLTHSPLVSLTWYLHYNTAWPWTMNLFNINKPNESIITYPKKEKKQTKSGSKIMTNKVIFFKWKYENKGALWGRIQCW